MSRNSNPTKRTNVEASLPRTRSLTKDISANQLEKKKTSLNSSKGTPRGVALANAKNADVQKLQGRTVQPSRNLAHPLPKLVTVTKGQNNQRLLHQQSLKSESGVTTGRTASKAVNMPVKDQIHSRLKRKSPWYDSIMSPMTGACVKIPDSTGTETGTFQHVEQITVPVNAKGVSGLRVISPYINNFVTLGGSADGSNYQTTGPASDTPNLQWGDGTLPTRALPFKKTPPVVKANCQSHRIVSAAVIGQPEISTLNDAGEMLAFLTPFGAQASNVNYQTLQFFWDSTMIPVNKHSPLVSRWYPLSSDVNYYDGGAAGTVGAGNYSYEDFVFPNEPAGTNPGVVPWEFGVVCTGMSPSTGVVRYTVIINYEFIPITTAAMISTEPSPIDPTEESLVKEWISEKPMTSMVSQKYASQASGESDISDRSDPTGFGMLFNVVEEMLPFAKGAMKLLL